MPTWRNLPVRPLGADWREGVVAEEAPVGVLYNGIPHAVMMATPADLEDFAVGFSLTEGIVGALGDMRGIEHRETTDGVGVDIALTPERLHAFLARRRVRSLRGHTSCGLCGVEEIAQVHAALPSAPAGEAFTRAALRRALTELPARQALNRRTRAAHAAAFATADGEIVLLREDVGRHNALDKLIGAALRQPIDLAAGFCVITSRCSYEMVQKALMAGIPAIVAISAPTALAVETAERSGLTLIALAREESQLLYTGAGRLREDPPG